MGTTLRRFVGQNIRATPAMRYKKVREDLRAIKEAGGSVYALQEMKWPWYWTALFRVFGLPRPKLKGWGRHPRSFMGARSAQPIVWRRKVYKLKKRKRKRLHGIAPGISLARFANAVLLEDRDTGLRCWYLSTHYIPGGSGTHGNRRRQRLWRRSVRRTEELLEELLDTGWPVLGSLDGNARGRIFSERIRGKKVYYIGERGIDYLILINNDKASVVIQGDGRINASDLNTDHAGRIGDHSIHPRGRSND